MANATLLGCSPGPRNLTRAGLRIVTAVSMSRRPRFCPSAALVLQVK